MPTTISKTNQQVIDKYKLKPLNEIKVGDDVKYLMNGRIMSEVIVNIHKEVIEGRFMYFVKGQKFYKF